MAGDIVIRDAAPAERAELEALQLRCSLDLGTHAEQLRGHPEAVRVPAAQIGRGSSASPNPDATAFYETVGFVDDGAVQTRFGPARRMHLDL